MTVTRVVLVRHSQATDALAHAKLKPGTRAKVPPPDAAATVVVMAQWVTVKCVMTVILMTVMDATATVKLRLDGRVTTANHLCVHVQAMPGVTAEPVTQGHAHAPPALQLPIVVFPVTLQRRAVVTVCVARPTLQVVIAALDSMVPTVVVLDALPGHARTVEHATPILDSANALLGVQVRSVKPCARPRLRLTLTAHVRSAVHSMVQTIDTPRSSLHLLTVVDAGSKSSVRPVSLTNPLRPHPMNASSRLLTSMSRHPLVSRARVLNAAVSLKAARSR